MEEHLFLLRFEMNYTNFVNIKSSLFVKKKKWGGRVGVEAAASKKKLADDAIKLIKNVA